MLVIYSLNASETGILSLNEIRPILKDLLGHIGDDGHHFARRPYRRNIASGAQTTANDIAIGYKAEGKKVNAFPADNGKGQMNKADGRLRRVGILHIGAITMYYWIVKTTFYRIFIKHILSLYGIYTQG